MASIAEHFCLLEHRVVVNEVDLFLHTRGLEALGKVAVVQVPVHLDHGLLSKVLCQVTLSVVVGDARISSNGLAPLGAITSSRDALRAIGCVSRLEMLKENLI